MVDLVLANTARPRKCKPESLVCEANLFLNGRPVESHNDAGNGNGGGVAQISPNWKVHHLVIASVTSDVFAGVTETESNRLT